MGPKETVVSPRRAAPNGRVYYSYVDIHQLVSGIVDTVSQFKPEVIIAIGGGGFIPARMLRSWLKIRMVSVSLKLYDDETDTAVQQVERIQWLEDSAVRGKRVLIVDEIDDTRRTLQYCVDELIKLNEPAAIAIAVLHNKQKQKLGVIPDNVKYFSCQDIRDEWVVYPWEATSADVDIKEHEELALYCREGSGNGESGSSSWLTIAIVIAVGLACTKRLI